MIGGLAPRTQSALLPRVLAKYEGWPFKVVHGYPGFNEVLIAMERGEVDGLLTAGQISRPDMVTSGFLIPILQSLDGAPGRSAAVRRRQRFQRKSLAGTAACAEPDWPAADGAAEYFGGNGSSFCARSYLQMAADKDFRDESEKRGMPVGRALGGADLHKLVVEQSVVCAGNGRQGISVADAVTADRLGQIGRA